MTHTSNPLDVNKHLLCRIGATHQQINSLAGRPFASLPKWAKRRIKALRSFDNDPKVIVDYEMPNGIRASEALR